MSPHGNAPRVLWRSDLQARLPGVRWLDRAVYVFLVLIDAAMLLFKMAVIYIPPHPFPTSSLPVVISGFKSPTGCKVLNFHDHQRIQASFWTLYWPFAFAAHLLPGLIVAFAFFFHLVSL